MSLTKVTMRLKLNDSAPADDIVKAIDAIENKANEQIRELKDTLSSVQDKAKADTEEMDRLKAKMKKLEEDKAKNDAELEECKNKLSAMEKDKKDAEEKAEGERVKNMVEGFAKAGRIKNEETVKLEWCETAKTLGYDKVKNMIEALPLNKVATPLNPEPNKVTEALHQTNALSLAVRNRLKREGKL